MNDRPPMPPSPPPDGGAPDGADPALADVDPDDVIASALVDGEATAGQRERVAADPGLQARANALAATVRALAEPVPPAPAGQRDRHLAAAMAEWDTRAAGPAAPAY